MSNALEELVVLSGKGGTGKTSVTAALAALAKQAVLVDCDVDASNLPLVLAPQQRQRNPFLGGARARIDPERCVACGRCRELCRFGAVIADPVFRVEQTSCEGCGVCVDHCPAGAIALIPAEDGEWFVSDTRCGPLVHARLHPGQGNSGKLVTLVCEQARRIARETGRRLLLMDGPPGIGCPVIACLNRASHILVVTEPTPSGEHDLERVLALARHFAIPTSVCVNKSDLNPQMATRLESHAAALGASVLGRIPYDPAMTAAQRQGQTILQYDPASPAARAITQLWPLLAAVLTPCPAP
jgi:MinD superfamily P-loop ATPase